MFFFFKQKTAYEMRISDWSSDVCSSDLIWGQQLMQAAMVPSAKFVPQKALVSHTYASPTMWYARPDIRQNNPALWTPAGVTTDGSGPAALFFIHPTSSLERSKWNAPLADKDSAERPGHFR